MSHNAPPKPGGFEWFEQQPQLKELFQAAALEYLKTEDREYFEREFSGEVDAEGYLLKKDGTNSNTLPSQNIGPKGMDKVVLLAKAKMAERR